MRTVSAFFFLPFVAYTNAFTVHIGAPTLDCSPTGYADIASALQFFVLQSTVPAAHKSLAIVDASYSYPVTYTAELTAANCSAAALASAVRRAGGSCQFLLGGVGYAEAQSYAANDVRRVLVHAGTTPDDVYRLGLPYVYGITTPPSQYAVPALRAMVLYGIGRIAVAWRTDAADPSLAAACAGAVAQAPLLALLRPGLTLLNFTYTAADVAAAAAGAAEDETAGAGGFFPRLVADVLAAGAEALIACDEASGTAALAAALTAAGAGLKAVWMADAGAADAAAAAASMPYLLSAAQWTPAVQYGDSLFGTAADYAAAFKVAVGRPPSADAAAASAAALTLATALSRAFAGCNVSADVAATGDTWRLLLDPSAISCTPERPGGGAAAAAATAAGAALGPGGAAAAADFAAVSGSGGNVTGYSLVMAALLAGRFETFYGPVEFSALRRNVGRPAVTTQVQRGGGVEVVLPAEAASAALVVAAPSAAPKPRKLSPPHGIVAGLVLGCAAVMGLAVLLGLYRRQRRRHRNLFGQVRPPGLSPLTTLLITDVESSTTLWEALPPSVMERAMELHDSILQGLAAEHDGYESANEGDSFVLAFHNPLEAVSFAVAAQQRLLVAAWPEALLRHERAEAVWMSISPDGARLAAACATSPWCGELLSAAYSKGLTAHSVGGGGGAGLGLGLSLASLTVRAHSLQRSLAGAARGTLRRIASFTAAASVAPAAAGERAGRIGSGAGGAAGGAGAGPGPGPGPGLARAGSLCEGAPGELGSLDAQAGRGDGGGDGGGDQPTTSAWGGGGGGGSRAAAAPPPAAAPLSGLRVVDAQESGNLSLGPGGGAGSAGGGGGGQAEAKAGAPSLHRRTAAAKAPSAPRSAALPLPTVVGDAVAAGAASRALGRGTANDRISPAGGAPLQSQSKLPLQPLAAVTGVVAQAAAAPPPPAPPGAYLASGTAGQRSLSPPSCQSSPQIMLPPPPVRPLPAVTAAAAAAALPLYDADSAMSGGGGRGDTGGSDHVSASPFSATAAVAAAAEATDGADSRPASAPAARGLTVAAAATWPRPPTASATTLPPAALTVSAASPAAAAAWASHGGAGAGAGRPPIESPVPTVSAASAATGGSGLAAGWPSRRVSSQSVVGQLLPLALSQWRDTFARARASVGSIGGLVSGVVGSTGGGGGGPELAAAPSRASSGRTARQPPPPPPSSSLTAAPNGGAPGFLGDVGGGDLQRLGIAVPGAGAGGDDRLDGLAPAPAGAGAGTLRNAVLGKLIDSMFCRASAGDSCTRLLAQRGLRVRMGLHSGLSDPHAVTVNKASGRAQYGGPFLAVAKRTSDVAHGGQVVLTEDAYRQLPARCLQHRAWLLHAGQHQLADPASAACPLPGEEAEAECEYQLYEVLGYELGVRLALLPPLRSPALLLSGVLGAPVGCLAVAFMYVHALPALMGWNSELTGEAVELFHRVASHSCCEFGGYVSESAEGLVLAAFRDPATALLWALSAQQAMLAAPWDPQLLEHELAEEVSVLVPASEPATGGHAHPSAAAAAAAAAASAPSPATPQPLTLLGPSGAAAGGLEAYGSGDGGDVPPGMVRRVLLRGLRMRVGVDVGRLTESISPLSSTVVYRGKSMNRAARIGMLASASQILCSAAAWAAAAAAAGPAAAEARRRISAVSLGRHVLRGVADPMEVFHCRLRPPALPGAAADDANAYGGAAASPAAAAEDAFDGSTALSGGAVAAVTAAAPTPLPSPALSGPGPASRGPGSGSAMRLPLWGSSHAGGAGGGSPRVSLLQRRTAGAQQLLQALRGQQLLQLQQQKQQQHNPRSVPLVELKVAAEVADARGAGAASAPLPPPLFCGAGGGADAAGGADDAGGAGVGVGIFIDNDDGDRRSAPEARAHGGLPLPPPIPTFEFAFPPPPVDRVAGGCESSGGGGGGGANGDGAIAAPAAEAGAGVASLRIRDCGSCGGNAAPEALCGPDGDAAAEAAAVLAEDVTAAAAATTDGGGGACHISEVDGPVHPPLPAGSNPYFPDSRRLAPPHLGAAAAAAAADERSRPPLLLPSPGPQYRRSCSVADSAICGVDGDGDLFDPAILGAATLHAAAVRPTLRHSGPIIPSFLRHSAGGASGGGGGGLRGSRGHRGSSGSVANLSGSVLAAMASAASHLRRTGGGGGGSRSRSRSASGARSATGPPTAAATGPAALPLRYRLSAAASALVSAARGGLRPPPLQLSPPTVAAQPQPARSRRRSVMTPRAAAMLDPAAISRSLLGSSSGSAGRAAGRPMGRRSCDNQRTLMSSAAWDLAPPAGAGLSSAHTAGSLRTSLRTSRPTATLHYTYGGGAAAAALPPPPPWLTNEPSLPAPLADMLYDVAYDSVPDEFDELAEREEAERSAGLVLQDGGGTRMLAQYAEAAMAAAAAVERSSAATAGGRRSGWSGYGRRSAASPVSPRGASLEVVGE